MAGKSAVVRVSIVADNSKLSRQLKDSQSKLKTFGKTAAKVGGLVGVGAGLGLAALAKSAVDVEAQFGKTMRTVAAVTDAPAKEIKQLNDLAVQLGQSTVFSANEAAQAMLELSKAGIDSATIMDGAAQSTLDLATAAGTDLATAATIAANAMNAFKIPAKNLGDVTTALVGGANASTASVESLQMGLAQVGSGAVNAGLSFNETVAALSAFDNAGVKGSDAGTSLKTMLQRLVPTTSKAAKEMKNLGLDFTDAHGNFKDLDEIAQELKVGLKGMSDSQRTAALQTIFGSDATRAASILAREGKKGIDKYTKATHDKEAAERAAKAATEGTSGALERISSTVETAQLKLGQELAPAVQKAADYLGKNLVPAMEDAIDFAKLFGESMQPLVGVFQGLVSALEPVVKWLVGLPDPIKKIGIEAGVAAALIWKLSPAFTSVKASASLAAAQVKQFAAEMTYAETRGSALRGGLAKLGPAAKAAAGVGGMVALAEGSKQSNDNLKTLMDTAGGAAIGFSVAGPWGAAIGGAAGLMLSLKDAFKDTEGAARNAAREVEKKESWSAAKESVQELTDKLHGTVRAYNDVTAAAVQQGFRDEAGKILPWVKNLEAAGVSQDTLTRAMLGQKDAQKLVDHAQGNVNANLKARKDSLDVAKKAYNDYALSVADANARSGATGPTTEQANEMDRLRGVVESTENQYKDYKTTVDAGNKAMGETTRTVEQQNALEKSRRASLGLTKKAYDALPTEVRTKVEAEGAPQSKRSVMDFIKQAKLVPKDVISVLKATGTELSKAQAKALGIEYDKLPDEVTTEGKFKKGNAASDAKAGGQSAGYSFSSGYAQGIADGTITVENAARAIAGAAQAAAKHKDMSQSPSKVMKKAGGDFSEGYARGIENGAPRAAQAATTVSKAAQSATLKALRRTFKVVKKEVAKGSAGVSSALGRVNDLITRQLDRQYAAREKSIKKRLKGKAEDAALKRLETRWKKHVREVGKSLKKLETRLKANGKAQDALQSGNFLPYLNKAGKLYKGMVAAGVHNLDEARSHLADLRQESKDYAQNIKDVFIAFGDVTQLGIGEDGTVKIEDLTKSLQDQVLAAQTFANNITKLKDRGVSQTVIDQIIAAGPEAGAATAQAMAGATDAQLAEIDKYTKQLSNLGSSLGNTLADNWYASGIKAADGLVKGLQSKQADLDAAAVKMAKALAKAVKKELGIKSPSRVMAQLGEQAAMGLAIGVDQTYASTAGTGLANSLVSAFGSPQLKASAIGGGSSRMQVEVKLSAQQVSQLERGRSIQLDLDAYKAAGGRSRS